jgi:non-specific serine/threonine protein kinase/serine/threonine-protein kinase
VVARFEAERQALALTDHPALATVFDGRSTPEERPYFAMGYVNGEPITISSLRTVATLGIRIRLLAAGSTLRSTRRK